MTRSGFYAILGIMEEEGQQISSQPPILKQTIKPSHVAVVLFFIFLSGTFGYFIGRGTGEVTKNKVEIQPITRIATIKQQSEYMAISASPTPIIISIPISTMTPAPTIETIAPKWQPYTRGQTIKNAGILMNYPQGWTIRLKDEGKLNYPGYTANFSLDIDFLPPDKQINPSSIDWMGWGAMTIDVYPPYSTVENWFSAWLRTPINGINNNLNKRSYYQYTTKQIGNKTAYFIKASTTAPDDVKAGFAPSYIVLGTLYTYELGYSQNGAGGFVQRIESDIFPTMIFN